MAIINQGQVVLQGNPQEQIDSIQGKVWKKSIEKDELQAYKEEYKVISERLLAGKPEIHVLSDSSPDSSFESVEADLEDVYFGHILGDHSSVESPELTEA